MALELELVFLCARLRRTDLENARVHKLLSDGVDWTDFVVKVRRHGLTSLIGSALAQTAPAFVPDEILGAFNVASTRIRDGNQVLFDELTRVLSRLEKAGIPAIPFKGPILALEAYQNLALREFRDLDFLLHDNDVDRAMPILRHLGYERQLKVTESQARLIRRIQGQEILFSTHRAIAIEPHIRLIPLRMALSIDHAALWQRAQRTTWNGFATWTLEPVDTLLLLAVHGGKEFWWRMNWACDVAAFCSAHEALNWDVLLERASAYGCRRMVLLALLLGHAFFSARVPESVLDRARADRVVGQMVQSIEAQWRAGEVLGPPSNRRLSWSRLLLHDRMLQRASYIARTWFLPGPEIVSWIALPRPLRFGYVPLKVLHDAILLPSWKAYCKLTRTGKKPRRQESADLKVH